MPPQIRAVMDRRIFVVTITGGVLATPLAALAQLAGSPARLGVLPFGSPSNPYDRSLVEAFRFGLREVGLVENRDVVLDVASIASEPETAQAVSGLMQRGAKSLLLQATEIIQ
jgi:hypothetical protein